MYAYTYIDIGNTLTHYYIYKTHVYSHICMYCFFANVKIKQAKQDWPNLPVLGSHSMKSSSSLEHSADETRSSDVGCVCQRKNNGVGGRGREKRGRDKETNEQKDQRLITMSCFPSLLCFSSLKRACWRIEHLKLLCSCEWRRVQTTCVDFMKSWMTPGGSRRLKTIPSL